MAIATILLYSNGAVYELYLLKSFNIIRIHIVSFLTGYEAIVALVKAMAISIAESQGKRPWPWSRAQKWHDCAKVKVQGNVVKIW
jgi:hypothetical protein